jgi:hypothetical protein
VPRFPFTRRKDLPLCSKVLGRVERASHVAVGVAPQAHPADAGFTKGSPGTEGLDQGSNGGGLFGGPRRWPDGISTGEIYLPESSMSNRN